MRPRSAPRAPPGPPPAAISLGGTTRPWLLQGRRPRARCLAAVNGWGFPLSSRHCQSWQLEAELRRPLLPRHADLRPAGQQSRGPSEIALAAPAAGAGRSQAFGSVAASSFDSVKAPVALARASILPSGTKVGRAPRWVYDGEVPPHLRSRFLALGVLALAETELGNGVRFEARMGTL